MNRRQILKATLAGLVLPKEDCTCKLPADNPLSNVGIHICAFHIGAYDPSIQLDVHHYCAGTIGEVTQCLLYDSNKKNARLIGIEYVISETVFANLPDPEKKYWHPHSYEIREGLLLAQDISKDCEKELMKGLLNTWGKTWHTWDPKDAVPLGSPMLMWSATKNRQVREKLLDDREKKLGISTEQIKKERVKYLP